MGILLAFHLQRDDEEENSIKLSKSYSQNTTSTQSLPIPTNEIIIDDLSDDLDIEIFQDHTPLSISIEPMVLGETEVLSELLENPTPVKAEEVLDEVKNDYKPEDITQVASEETPKKITPKSLPIEFKKTLSYSIKPITNTIASYYNTSLNLSSNFIKNTLNHLQNRQQNLSKFKKQGVSVNVLGSLATSFNSIKNAINNSNLNSKKPKKRNPRNNVLSKISHINVQQKKHLTNIYNFLKKFQIDGVRLDGVNSRIHANGYAYHINTFVSNQPTLKLIGITQNELIFKDEYDQEYRKEISQNN